MSTNTIKNKKILFLFPHRVLDQLPKVMNKEIPSERLYGVTELIQNGWKVDISDDRHQGLFGHILRLLKPYGINLINYSTIKRIMRNDVIIVKDDFSLMTTLVCRLFGKIIIYKDSMFQLPTRFWKRWSTFINLRMASEIICYSKHQAKVWEKQFNLNEGTIKTLHYCVDTTFYPEIEYELSDSQHAISVGRDPGRDYICLSRAIQINRLPTKLVTLPYLLSEEIKNNEYIMLLERISYSELFELYSNSFFSVVPLGKYLDYPTGIRAVLESMVLGIPVIATRTPVLVEYFEENEEIIFVDAENDDELASAMKILLTNYQFTNKISNAGKTKARSLYNMQIYAKGFEKILINSINS